MDQDQEAAYRMIRVSGQRGVPVITIGENVVVGFNRSRLEELLAGQSARKPSLGLTVADAVPRSQTKGAYVGRVKAGSPAAHAGLKVGDVIAELNGRPVYNAADLERIMAVLPLAQRVPIVYVRRGMRVEVQLSLS